MQFSLWNFIRYNVVGGGDSALYGVEDSSYYLRNGANNLNLIFVLGLAYPLVALLDVFQITGEGFFGSNCPQTTATSHYNCLQEFGHYIERLLLQIIQLTRYCPCNKNWLKCQEYRLFKRQKCGISYLVALCKANNASAVHISSWSESKVAPCLVGFSCVEPAPSFCLALLA